MFLNNWSVIMGTAAMEVVLLLLKNSAKASINLDTLKALQRLQQSEGKQGSKTGLSNIPHYHS